MTRSCNALNSLAEHFGFHHGFRNGGTVDGHVITGRAAAQLVKASRNEILARSGFAIEHDAYIGCCDFRHRLAKTLDFARGAQNPVA